MRILISNDDGIFAPGIAALVRAFAEAGHEIVVCAPDRQRSAASHSLSFHPLSVKEVPFEGAKKAYAIGGTPVDCVKLGLGRLYSEADYVVSGINKGYNVGSDILYSGTVGAAMEGALCGRQAMAVSVEMNSEQNYDKAAALAVRLFDTLLHNPIEKRCVLNVNYPACEEIRGVRTAAMKSLLYDDFYVDVQLEDGSMAYQLRGSISERQEDEDSDYTCLLEGYATVTVLNYDMTDVKQTQVWNALI